MNIGYERSVMMNIKKLIITVLISLFVFVFLGFLIYLIYCYVYYDSNQENKYLDNFNNGNYSFVYDNLYNRDLLDRESYDTVVDFMFNKDELTKIYKKYYNGKVYVTLDDFLNEFYYDKKINLEDITFNSNGTTNLFEKRELLYEKIVINNKHNIRSAIGVFKNILIDIEENSSITIDDKLYKCFDECKLDYYYGGIHKVLYKSNNNTYFALININDNNQVIDVTNIGSIIKIEG